MYSIMWQLQSKTLLGSAVCIYYTQFKKGYTCGLPYYSRIEIVHLRAPDVLDPEGMTIGCVRVSESYNPRTTRVPGLQIIATAQWLPTLGNLDILGLQPHFLHCPRYKLFKFLELHKALTPQVLEHQHDGLCIAYYSLINKTSEIKTRAIKSI